MPIEGFPKKGEYFLVLKVGRYCIISYLCNIVNINLTYMNGKKNWLTSLLTMLLLITSAVFIGSCSSSDDDTPSTKNQDTYATLLGKSYDEVRKSSLIGTVKEEEKSTEDAKITSVVSLDGTPFSATFRFDVNFRLERINFDQTKSLDYSDDASRLNMLKEFTSKAKAKYGEPYLIVMMPSNKIVSTSEYKHYCSLDEFWSSVYDNDLTKKIYIYFYNNGVSYEYTYYSGTWSDVSVSREFGIIMFKGKES